MTKEISGLGDILEQFDGILIDQFGVLHDGVEPFEDAAPCLKKVAAAGVPVVAITNSGRMKEPNRQRLDRFGFTPDLIPDVVTSGMVARDQVLKMLKDGTVSQGDGVLNLTRENDVTVLEGLGLELSDEISSSTKLVFISGLQPEALSRQDYLTMLRPLAEQGVPAICANPDHMVYVNGKAAFGPGLVAADYEQAGGQVTFVGKPGADIFVRSLEILGSLEPSRVLMIGDSHHHDIAGAAAVGCKTLLIANGVQAQADTVDVAPDFSIPSLRY